MKGNKKVWIYVGIAVVVWLQWKGQIDLPVVSDVVALIKGILS